MEQLVNRDEEVDVVIPNDILITNGDDLIVSIIYSIYPKSKTLEIRLTIKRVQFMAPTHDVVDIINDRMMKFLDSEEEVLLNSDGICQCDLDVNFNNDLYTYDILNSIDIGGLPKHKLKLKVGVPVMLLRNVDPSAGLCKCTRLQITQLGDKMIEAKILTGTNVGTRTCIPRMLICPSDKRIPFRFQHPVFTYGMLRNDNIHGGMLRNDH